MFIMDVDGVLTDGRIMYDVKGNESKSFHAHDGYGITRAIKKGILFALISGRTSKAVEHRAKHLGITEVYQGIADKTIPYRTLQKKYQLKDSESCYIGDDEFDVPLLRLVGFSATPADAIEIVKPEVDYVTKEKGGSGAVRELLDMILQSKNLL